MAFKPYVPTGTVISDISNFDRASGSVLERLIFNHRLIIVILCAIVTAVLGFQATKMKVNASFEGTVPWSDPWMQNYKAHVADLQAQGNSLRIVVAAQHGTIASEQYLQILQDINDKILYLPGINRPFMTSLWTPTTRYTAADATGFESDAVIDGSYQGTPDQVAGVMQNIQKTHRIGELVANDWTSSMIYAPLMDHNGVTGGPIDYGELAQDINNLRSEYAKKGVTLYVVGYAMVVGDMILGIKKILTFFLVSILIATAMLYWFTRSIRCTALVVICTLVAVIWQLGVLPTLGYQLDPYSVLVPFLIFAIGMSHGAQKMNGVMQDIGRGTHKLVAARYTFRRLFVAGFTALSCDAVGFAVLYLIKIQEIRELSIIASCGVAILIFTNLILLPILLSYIGVGHRAALRSLQAEQAASDAGIWGLLTRFTTMRWAAPTLVIAFVLAGIGYYVGLNEQVGVVGNGAPELRAASQYNQDNAYITAHYDVSPYQLILMSESKPYGCTNLSELRALNEIGWQLQQMPQVQSTSSLGAFLPVMTQLLTDNSPKWNELVQNQMLIAGIVPDLPLGFNNEDCSLAPLTISLQDQKARTLDSVTNEAQRLVNLPINQGPDFKIKLLAGNSGITAATNRVIRLANANMLLWIYGAVAILCYITFRSWLAVICAILPLILTSLLCRALMVWLNIGVTVATLPVVALGVGIGVDYALYVVGVMITHLRAGLPIEEAYLRSLRFTGRVVMLTGFTLAAGVGTWIFAPIKFQADMGMLLAFMFLWNMLGALVLLPALACFLLKPAKNGLVTEQERLVSHVS
jgi:predicted RND superfamily exporter protein